MSEEIQLRAKLQVQLSNTPMLGDFYRAFDLSDYERGTLKERIRCLERRVSELSQRGSVQ